MRTIFLGCIDGFIRASRINHMNIVTPEQRIQTSGQISFLVSRQNDNRNHSSRKFPFDLENEILTLLGTSLDAKWAEPLRLRMTTGVSNWSLGNYDHGSSKSWHAPYPNEVFYRESRFRNQQRKRLFREEFHVPKIAQRMPMFIKAVGNSERQILPIAVKRSC